MHFSQKKCILKEIWGIYEIREGCGNAIGNSGLLISILRHIMGYTV